MGGMGAAIINTKTHLSTKAAAEVLGLSVDSVRRYLNNALSDDPALRPKLFGERANGAWFIPIREVNRYKRERRPVGKPKADA